MTTSELLRQQVSDALPAEASWRSVIGVVRKLGHPDPALLGEAVGEMLLDLQIGCAQGNIEEFPNETWALVELSDEDWKAVKSGADTKPLSQYVYRRFIAHAHRSGVKDSEIRYMKAFMESLLKKVDGAMFMPHAGSELQLLRPFTSDERLHRLATVNASALKSPGVDHTR